MKILFVELLHHHECVELPLRALSGVPGTEVHSILGGHVAEALGLAASERTTVIEQPGRAEFLSVRGRQRMLKIPGQVREVRRACQIVGRRMRDFDLVYFSTLESPLLAPLCWELRKASVPFVATMHHMDSTGPECLRRNAMAFGMFPLLRVTLEKARGLVLLADYLRPPPHLRHLPILHSSNRAAIDEPKASSGGPTRMWTMGARRGDERRDPTEVLNAAERLLNRRPDLAHAFHVDFVSVQDEQFVRRVESSPAREHVQVHRGNSSEREWLARLRRSDLAILTPNVRAGYGRIQIAGAVGDVRAAGIPGLIPREYAPGWEDRGQFVRYSAGEMDLVLERLLDGELSQLEPAAERAREDLSLPRLSEGFSHFLAELNRGSR